jgi:nitric-oxide synthase, plant
MASPPLPFFLSSPFPQTSRVSPKPCLARAASPPPPPPPTDDGVGPAAPTRGDRFIGRQLATEAAARVLAAQHAETRRRRKDKRQALATKQPSGLASCYGCGAPLQTEEDGAPGYVDPDTYQLVRFVLHLTSFLLLSIIHSLSLSFSFFCHQKKRHRQLRTVLCGRCKLLSHGHMVTAVGGHGGYPGGKQFVSAEQLREKLSYLRHEKALIVKLVNGISVPMPHG